MIIKLGGQVPLAIVLEIIFSLKEMSHPERLPQACQTYFGLYKRGDELLTTVLLLMQLLAVTSDLCCYQHVNIISAKATRT